MKTLILGIGNVLLSDEGVGVHIARALAGSTLPADTSVVEAGTAFLDILGDIEQAEKIILVDAMEAGGKPGTVYRIPFDECKHPEMLVSLHGFDISRVLYMAGNCGRPEVIVFGVEPAVIEWGVELSPTLARSVQPAVEAILAEVASVHAVAC